MNLAVRRKSQLAALRDDRENRAYLCGVPFPSQLHLTEISADCVRNADAIVMAIPSGFARETLAPVKSAIPPESLGVKRQQGNRAGFAADDVPNAGRIGAAGQ